MIVWSSSAPMTAADGYTSASSSATSNSRDGSSRRRDKVLPGSWQHGLRVGTLRFVVRGRPNCGEGGHTVLRRTEGRDGEGDGYLPQGYGRTATVTSSRS